MTVNVYVDKRNLESGELVPIVYFIHGGAFNFGSNQGFFKNLVEQQGVIVISIAYRLGMYGFLWFPESEDPAWPSGNWGLVDQQTAMEWAQTWAKYFGGDVTNAALNGCSAGSESLWYHLTTPESWGYFNRAVTVGVGLNTVRFSTLIN